MQSSTTTYAQPMEVDCPSSTAGCDDIDVARRATVVAECNSDCCSICLDDFSDDPAMLTTCQYVCVCDDCCTSTSYQQARSCGFSQRTGTIIICSVSCNGHSAAESAQCASRSCNSRCVIVGGDDQAPFCASNTLLHVLFHPPNAGSCHE